MDKFHIVVINLKHRADRRAKLEKNFAGWNLHYIEAIDKNDLPLHVFDAPVKTPGAWACFLSHQRAFLHSLQFPLSIVVEDDCRFLTPKALLRALEWCEANDNHDSWDIMSLDYLFLNEEHYPAGISRLVDSEARVFEMHNAWLSTMTVYNSRIREYLTRIPWAFYGNPIDGVFHGTFKMVSMNPKIVYQDDQGDIGASYSSLDPALDSRVYKAIKNLKPVAEEDQEATLRILSLQGFDLRRMIREEQIDILAFCGNHAEQPWFMGLYRLLGLLEPAVRLTLSSVATFCTMPQKKYSKLIWYNNQLTLDGKVVSLTPELMTLCNKYENT